MLEDQTEQTEVTEEVVAEAPATEETTQEAAPETEVAADEGIELDGQKFKTQKEALAYAQANIMKLQMEREIADAYRQGIADAAGPLESVTPQAAAPAEDNFEEEFYRDPKATLEKVRLQAIEEAETRILTKQQMQNAEEKLWSDFQNAHPDLADFREDVVHYANVHKDVVQALVRTKGQQAAFDYVAQKTRAKFQAYVEKMKPATALPATKPAVTPTGQKSVTPPKAPTKPLSFMEEVRQNKMSRMK